MADFSDLTDQELRELARDSAQVEAMPDRDRDDLQVELCRRNRWKFTKPDGTVVYEPPDWVGD